MGKVRDLYPPGVDMPVRSRLLARQSSLPTPSLPSSCEYSAAHVGASLPLCYTQCRTNYECRRRGDGTSARRERHSGTELNFLLNLTPHKGYQNEKNSYLQRPAASHFPPNKHCTDWALCICRQNTQPAEKRLHAAKHYEAILRA
jgi:hypothetical protein